MANELESDYREEHLFALKQSLESFRYPATPLEWDWQRRTEGIAALLNPLLVCGLMTYGHRLLVDQG